MPGKRHLKKAILPIFILFILFSWVSGFETGIRTGETFVSFTSDMITILPFAFIMIGLFETWVKKESIEKHMGENSGLAGYGWSILLAGTTVGGIYVAFPVAVSLRGKGAALGVVLTYLGASAVCRIPMTIFEASFMGFKFSIIRLAVSIPLIILSSMWLGGHLEKKGFKINDIS